MGRQAPQARAGCARSVGPAFPATPVLGPALPPLPHAPRPVLPRVEVLGTGLSPRKLAVSFSHRPGKESRSRTPGGRLRGVGVRGLGIRSQDVHFRVSFISGLTVRLLTAFTHLVEFLPSRTLLFGDFRFETSE